MEIIKKWSVPLLSVFALLTLSLVYGGTSSLAEEPGLSTVTFYVR